MSKLPEVSEAVFQAQVLELAAICGWRTAHFRPAKTVKGWRTPVSGDGKGFPDTVFVKDSVFFAELKSERGKLSLEQKGWQEWLTAAGLETHVWKPSDWPEIEKRLLGRPARNDTT